MRFVALTYRSHMEGDSAQGKWARGEAGRAQEMHETRDTLKDECGRESLAATRREPLIY
jgi:hypothetical protein